MNKYTQRCNNKYDIEWKEKYVPIIEYYCKGVNKMYSLSFYEAVEKCLNGEGYIRGDQFKDGVFIRKQGEMLIAIDGFNANRVIGNFYISSGILSQKYKLFNYIEKDELINGKGKLSFEYTKIV